MGVLKTINIGDTVPEGKVWIVNSHQLLYGLSQSDLEEIDGVVYGCIGGYLIFIGNESNLPQEYLNLSVNVLEIDGEFVSPEKLSTNDYVVPEGKVFYSRSVDSMYNMLAYEGQRVRPSHHAAGNPGILLDLSKTKV